MNKNEYIREKFQISQIVLDLVNSAEEELRENFHHIEEIAEINQYKVMNAFSENKVSEAHLLPTTGYGYDDLGEPVSALVHESFTARLHPLARIGVTFHTL